MNFHIYHHHSTYEEKILKQLGEIMALLDALQTQVTANTTVIGFALAFINGVADKIAAAGTDPVKLADLTNQLKTQDDALAAALVANTPAAALAP